MNTKAPLLDQSLQRVLTANLVMVAIGVLVAHFTMPFVSPGVRVFTGIVAACVLLWSGVAIGGTFFLIHENSKLQQQAQGDEEAMPAESA